MEVEKALEARRQLGASLVANLGNILMQRRRNPIQTEVEVSGAKFNCVAVVNGFLACRIYTWLSRVGKATSELINNELQIEFCWLRNLRALSPLQHTRTGTIKITHTCICESIIYVPLKLYLCSVANPLQYLTRHT